MWNYCCKEVLLLQESLTYQHPYETEMSVAPLAIEVVCVCCLAAYLLHRYGDYKKQHILVTVAVFVAWYFSLMIVFVLPLDVSNVSVPHQLWHWWLYKRKWTSEYCFSQLLDHAVVLLQTCYRQCLADNGGPSTLGPSTATSPTNFTTLAMSNSTRAPESRAVRELQEQGAITATSGSAGPADSTWQPMVDAQSSQLVGPALSGQKACQKPWSYVDENILDTLWHVVYWTSQFLTW